MADLKVPFANAQAAEALAQGGPEWARKDRLGALDAFAATPVETSALFIRHVITEGAPVGQVALGPAQAAGAPEPAPVPAQSSAAAVIIDGVAAAVGISKDAAAQGVRFTSIRHALAEDPEWARERLSDPAVHHADKFFQLARALYQDGLILDVPQGVDLELPVRLDVHEPGAGRAAYWRFIARLGAGARVEVEEHQGLGKAGRAPGPSLAASTSEVRLDKDARMHYSALGNLPTDSGVFINRQAHVGPRAKMTWSLANFGGALTKSLVHTRLAGEDSQVAHAEVAFGTGAQRFDLSSFATHEGKRAKSDVLARAALRHKSRANVKGMITIENRGVEADSYLGQFALLLDDGARAIAIPGLEIETSQVTRAKHAAAVSQVDESQVFYLGSRGLDRDVARRLIVEGFLSPAVAGERRESFRERVQGLVAQRWGGA